MSTNPTKKPTMEESSTMATATSNTDLFDLFIERVADALAERLSGAAPAPAVAASNGKSTTKKVKETVEEETEETEAGTREEREAELRKARITSLRKMAVEAGYGEDDVKDADKDTLINTLLDEEFGDIDDADDDESDDVEDIDDEDEDFDEDSDDDEEDDEDDEEGDNYSREELEAMSAPELRRLAKEVGWTAADMKGLDQSELVDLFLGETTDDDDSDEDEEDEDEGYSEADLKAMSVDDLRALAKEWEVKIRKQASETPAAFKKRIIKALLAS